jgi:hypothetical protein
MIFKAKLYFLKKVIFTMNRLKIFHKELKEQVGDELLMPFVCNGNPLDTTVVIIGFNPTTEYKFWDFFTAEQGFDHAAEKQAYINLRLNKGKTKLSSTRLRITRLEDKLLEIYPDLTIMKMNLYAKASTREKDLKSCDRKDHIFNFLIKNIKPKFIITHGKQATQRIESLDFNDENYRHLKDTPVLPVFHLSRMSYAKVDAIVDEMRFNLSR